MIFLRIFKVTSGVKKSGSSVLSSGAIPVNALSNATLASSRSF